MYFILSTGSLLYAARFIKYGRVQPIFIYVITCHRGVLQFGFRHHGLDRERNPGQVEIAANKFFTDELDHFLTDGSDFIHLLFVATDLTTT